MLQQFFGLIRHSCGPNTHPTPTVFIQLFRILSLYSLVKPPKGSNVSGVDNLINLINAEDVAGAAAQRDHQEQLAQKINDIVENGKS